MRTKNFKIDVYRYDITLVQVERNDKSDDVIKFLKKFDILQKDLDDLKEGMDEEAVNGGHTLCNHLFKQIVCFFYPFTDNERRCELYAHEKRHVEDRICEWLGINDIEASAYLAGYLGVKFWEFAGLTHWDK